MQPTERSPAIKNKIRQLWGAPVVLDNFLTHVEQRALENDLQNVELKKIDGRGDYSLRIMSKLPSPVVDLFEKKLKYHFSQLDFKIREINYFQLERPYRIHSDAGCDPESIPYKNFVYWLETAQAHPPGLTLFRQYAHYSFSVFDDYQFNPNFLLPMDGFSDWVETPPHPPLASSHSHELSHLPIQILQNFQVSQQIDFAANRLVMFDACQFHCTSFSNNGEKRGLMIATEYVGK